MPKSMLDLEAGGTFDASYGGFKTNYYENTLGYTCTNNTNY